MKDKRERMGYMLRNAEAVICLLRMSNQNCGLARHACFFDVAHTNGWRPVYLLNAIQVYRFLKANVTDDNLT